MFAVDLRNFYRGMRAGLLGALFFCGSISGAAAVEVATYTLGPPDLNGAIVTLPINVTFSAALNEGIAFFGVDVSASAAALTSNWTDYSRFGFEKADPPFGAWEMIPGSEFGASATKSVVEFDTLTQHLPAGSYPLGNLVVNFEGSGVSPEEWATSVLLAPANTVIGIEEVGVPSSFRFITVQVIYIPESTTVGLTAIATVGTAVIGRRRRA